MQLPELHIRLPDWVAALLAQFPAVLPRKVEKMRLVIELARLNVLHGGGPFASVVFDQSGRPVAPGVNLVIPLNCSALHAEIVALSLAQQVLGRYDISDGGKAHFDLFASAEPCAMCLGAIPWSGIRRLVCGARDADARAIGFDEGDKPAKWVAALNKRGIDVVVDLLRKDALAVFELYRKSGGAIYNAGQ